MPHSRKHTALHHIIIAVTIGILASFVLVSSIAAAGETGDAAAAVRRPLYLPHMSWDEVAAYLKTSDMVIVPVGSIEQHGKHLPLDSDIVEATEICLQIGQKTGVIVAPSILAGVSEHHMAFPGTIALSPATFEAVLYETTQSLISHGFRRFIYYSGHGGNEASVSHVAYRINREKSAMAIDLRRVEFPKPDSRIANLKNDSHAGVEETSMMLYLAPHLVRMDKAENPVLSNPPLVKEVREKMDGASQAAVLETLLFQPAASDKQTATRDLTSNGVFSAEDVKTSTPELGRLAVEYRVQGVVRFIQDWKKVRP